MVGNAHPTVMLKKSQPIFAVRNVKETVAFYRDILGFQNEWFWGEPVSFAGIGWGDVHVMFNQQPELNVEGHEHHYWADEIDALYDQHQRKGAPIISPIGNKPWHIREYTVRDPNGYHLRFSGPLSYERPATASECMPDYIDIVERRPTFEEFLAIQQAVGWGKSYESYEIVKAAFTTFLAIDHRRRRPVGMTRVMLDSLGWYSIWDVAVLPEYQSQKIGSAMIEAAVKRLRDVSPGAFVYLFTMKPEFYAKLGFRQDGCSILKL
jgi:GNAT superfamily N-acetyltransferase/uncharacterized glyoxalase superfamily protein PhnB